MKINWNFKLDLLDIFRNGLNEEHRLFASTYARKAKKAIDKAMAGLGKEAVETREIAELFFRLLDEKLNLENRTEPPTKKEVKAALEQLKDVGRFSIFITAVILPGGVFSLIGLELLARKFGINFTIIPSSFKNKSKKQESNVSNSPK